MIKMFASLLQALVFLGISLNNINSLEEFPTPLHVVYYGFLAAKWKYIIPGQIKDFRESGLSDYAASFHAVLCGSQSDYDAASVMIREILQPLEGIPANISIQHELTNRHEYPGINAVYERAIIEPDAIYFYFHSKGMIYHKDGNIRIIEELLLNEALIKNWQNSLQIFYNTPHVDKVGYACAKEGYLWFNYFYVRGRYLKEKCIPPNPTPRDRQYYEAYLGEEGCSNVSYHGCHSIVFEFNKYSFYVPYLRTCDVVTAMNKSIFMTYHRPYIYYQPDWKDPPLHDFYSLD